MSYRITHFVHMFVPQGVRSDDAIQGAMKFCESNYCGCRLTFPDGTGADPYVGGTTIDFSANDSLQVALAKYIAAKNLTNGFAAV